MYSTPAPNNRKKELHTCQSPKQFTNRKIPVSINWNFELLLEIRDRNLNNKNLGKSPPSNRTLNFFKKLKTEIKFEEKKSRHSTRTTYILNVLKMYLKRNIFT
jgi:hypothetical protein